MGMHHSIIGLASGKPAVYGFSKLMLIVMAQESVSATRCVTSFAGFNHCHCLPDHSCMAVEVVRSRAMTLTLYADLK